MTSRSKTFLRRLLLPALTLGTLAGAAQAQTCPNTLSNQTLGSSSDGITMATNVTLRSTAYNAVGTTTLCRYRGTKVTYPARGGGPIQGGTVYFDRYTTVANPDPPEAWTVRLFNADNKFWCTGAVIAPDWILTAYHCTDSAGNVEKGSTVIGGAGVRVFCFYVPRRMCTPNPLLQSVQVASIHRAPKGDVVLIKLASPLVLNRYGSPAYGKSYDGRMPDSLQCLTGVGCTRYSGKVYGWTCSDPSNCPDGAESVGLQSVTFWANTQCGANYYPRTDKDICSTGGSDAAKQKGNSGAPLVASGLIAGVFTGNSPQTHAGNMQFANVTELTSWISSVVGADAHPKPL